MVDAGEEKAGDQLGKFGSEAGIPFDTNKQDSDIYKQDDQLESTKEQMSEVREENERLKTFLSKIVKDYQSLQTHLFHIIHGEQAKKAREESPKDFDVEDTELVSLSLGTRSNGHKIEEKTSACSKSKEHDQVKDALTLGLDMKSEGHSNARRESTLLNPSPMNSFEEPKEEASDIWPPSKMTKNLRNGDDELSQQVHAKRARVSVRARCDAPTMNDGCQWRKYGQKIAKGNPCPRAYYRCTVAPGCPVRKQVQRCAEDMSILITTYEGNHNHPLPVSATIIASTTSAAASILTSASSASCPVLAPAFPGLNFSLPDTSRPSQHYLPNLTSLSSNPSPTTITVDLTAPHSQPSRSNRFSSLSSNFDCNSRYSAANLNFSSSSSESTAFPSSWSSGFLSYGAQPYQPCLQKDSSATMGASATQHVLTDTIARAITSDPSFRSALAAAITSYVGADEARGSCRSGHVGETFASLAAMNGDGCGSGYLSRPESLSLDQRRSDSMILRAPQSFSGSRSASASPVGNMEHVG